MEPFHIKGEDFELGVYIGEDDIIYIRMKGNMTDDHKEELEAWDKKVREAMRITGENHPGHAYCLTDITGGVEADDWSLKLLKALILHNRSYITRTSVIGANFFMKNFMYIALAAAHRTNMKPFDSRGEAMEWLYRGDVEESETETKE